MPLTIGQLESAWADLATRYRVADCVSAQATFVFLLESPHIREVQVGAPVSGTSGLAMTRHLLGETCGRIPLGQLVLASARGARTSADACESQLQRIGLMNVCELPMQSSAYAASEKEEAQALIAILAGLRTSTPRTAYREPSKSLVQALLQERLYDRLSALTERRLTLVPCGNFARAYLQRVALLSPNWTLIDGVPHPSFNNWSKPIYAPVLSQMLATWTQEARDR